MEIERPIEKLLRRYGKKRRDEAGAPLEMHAATRRMFHGEVKRQYPQKSGGSSGSFGQVLRGWVPWLGWAGVTVVLISIGAFMFFSGTEVNIQLAKKAESPVSEAEQTIAPDQQNRALAPSVSPTQSKLPEQATGPAPRDRETAPPELTLGWERDARAAEKDEAGPPMPDRKLAQSRSPTAFEQTPASPAPAEERVEKRPEPSALAAAETVAETAQPARTERSVATAEARVPAAPTPPGSAAGQATSPTSIAASAELKKAEDSVRSFGSFAQSASYTNLGANTAQSPVLLKFKIEQAGDEWRVIDADGSTYVGRMQTARGDTAPGAFEAKGAQALRQQVSTNVATLRFSRAQVQNYYFQVQGTNLTLNQPVVFTWSFVGVTNGLADSAAVESRSAGEREASSTPVPGLLEGAQISGRAQLQDGKEIRINAFPTKP